MVDERLGQWVLPQLVRLVDELGTEQTGWFSSVMIEYWNDNYLLRSGIGSAAYTRPRLRCLDVRR